MACLHAKHQRIQVIDINDQGKKDALRAQKMINFQTRDSHTTVKISSDFEKVIFCSKTENYILEREGDHFNQNQLSWLDGMNVIRVISSDVY